MSLFGKMKAGLKNVANRVTGGYGEVSFQTDGQDFVPGQRVKVAVAVTAKEELKITKILLNLDGYETASFKDDDFLEDEEDVEANCSHSDYSFRYEGEVLGELTMAPGESKTFTHEFELPAELPPTYHGEHIKNTYQMKVRVDVPWGADLRAQEEVVVVTPPPEQRFEEVLVDQKNRSCKAELHLPRATVKPEEAVEFTLRLIPAGPVQVKTITAELRSVESMPGKLGRLPGYERRAYENNESTQERPQRIWTDHHLEVVSEQVKEDLCDGHQLSGPEEYKESLIVPESFGPTYRRGSVEHRVVLFIELQFGDGSRLEFQEEVLVCEGDWEPTASLVQSDDEVLVLRREVTLNSGLELTVGPRQVALLQREGNCVNTVLSPGRHILSAANVPDFIEGQAASLVFVDTGVQEFKWGTPNPIDMKDPEYGWVQLRLTGTVLVRVDHPGLFLQHSLEEGASYSVKELGDEVRTQIRIHLNDLVGKAYQSFEQIRSSSGEVAAAVKVKLSADCQQLGLEVRDVVVEQVVIPEEARQRAALKQAKSSSGSGVGLGSMGAGEADPSGTDNGYFLHTHNIVFRLKDQEDAVFPVTYFPGGRAPNLLDQIDLSTPLSAYDSFMTGLKQGDDEWRQGCSMLGKLVHEDLVRFNHKPLEDRLALMFCKEGDSRAFVLTRSGLAMLMKGQAGWMWAGFKSNSLTAVNDPVFSLWDHGRLDGEGEEKTWQEATGTQF